MACLQKTFEGTNLPAVVHKIVQVSFDPVKGDYSSGLKLMVGNQSESTMPPWGVFLLWLAA